MIGNRIEVIWEGPQLVNSSLGLVNRYLCRELLNIINVKLKPLPIEKDYIPLTWFPDAVKLTQAYRTNIPYADIHIRQQWPPSFRDMRGSRYVMFQPWEYGTIPKTWIESINKYVDEVWVNSEYTKEGYIRSGISPELIFTFPLGYDPDVYHLHGPQLAIKTNKKFKFLFVGGTIYRKGIDVLLQAYLNAFSCNDEVCLIIKDHGGNTHYQGQTQLTQIVAAQNAPNAAEIIYLNNDMSPYELASLYRACDCLIQPYRGEGFGLPILEAMACGIPPIIPNLGPAIEFTTEETSFRVPSKIQYFESFDLDTVLPVELISIESDILSQIMRDAFNHPNLVIQKGMCASRHVSESFTWDKIAKIVHQHIERLSISTPKEKPHENLDGFLQRITHQFEGSQNIREQLYSPFLRCFTHGDFVIDLGAGDGTWLRLLLDYGVNGVGVDLDLAKVNEMKTVGLSAVHANVIDYANSLSFQLDGLTMFHIIEHMNPVDAIQIIREVSKKFTYRGRIIIVTPNFKNANVAQNNFWLDITHLRPYPIELLNAILSTLGFRTIIFGTMNNDMDTFIFGSILANDNPFS